MQEVRLQQDYHLICKNMQPNFGSPKVEIVHVARVSNMDVNVVRLMAAEVVQCVPPAVVQQQHQQLQPLLTLLVQPHRPVVVETNKFRANSSVLPVDVDSVTIAVLYMLKYGVSCFIYYH